MSRDEYSREGIEKTARQLRESSRSSGKPLTHEEARARVVRAVRNDEKKNGR